MKKALYIILCSIFLLNLTGCSKSAKNAVEDYLAKYNNLDAEVLSDMDATINKENLTDEQKKIYEDALKRQYSDLTYEITNESYDGDEATITAKITVYDLYKSQMESLKYLSDNGEEFNDEKGVYSVEKYMTYKLNQLKDYTQKISYTIDFYVVKKDNVWTVSPLSNTDIEKLHGIYNYES